MWRKLCAIIVQELVPHNCARNIHTNVEKLNTLQVDKNTNSVELLSTSKVDNKFFFMFLHARLSNFFFSYNVAHIELHNIEITYVYFRIRDTTRRYNQHQPLVYEKLLNYEQLCSIYNCLSS